MSNKKEILLAFYGDDFTGSTDALEFMSRAGAKTVLFIEPPSEMQLSRYPDLDAFGVAGMTRSMKPDEMEKVLSRDFELLKQSNAKHIHYKVCSTFDSSPAIGSIGKAIEIGARIFPASCIPVVVAAPPLGRYTVFGNHFARMGTAGTGDIYRLDRHPSMSKHPVTPSEESDLRLHLAKQTHIKIGLVDILAVSQSTKAISDSIYRQIKTGHSIILFDALYNEQMCAIGECIDKVAGNTSLFSAGSSGIEMALGQHWNKISRLQPVSSWKDPGKAETMLVIAGSCSPVTIAQINKAVSNGFEQLRWDGSKEVLTAALAEAAAEWMMEGKSVIIHSNANERGDKTLPPEFIGTGLGRVAREVMDRFRYKRLVIAGGDTSSYAARALGIESVEMIASLVPGAPLCKANAPGSPVDGVEINFKGGQVGDENYFEILLNGKN